MKKIKVLIVCEYFPPINKIASVRPSKLAKFLTLNYNCEVIVVCRSPVNYNINNSSLNDLDSIKRVIRVSTNLFDKLIKNRRKLKAEKQNKKKEEAKIDSSTYSYKSNKASFINYLRRFFYALESKIYIFKAKKEINTIPTADIIITTFGPKSSSIIGKWFKKNNSSAFWVADHRDPVFNSSELPIFRLCTKSFVSRVCKNSNLLTAVSQGCMDKLYFDSHPNKTVLTNGFDREDISNIKYKKSEKFTLSYLGSLYKDKSDISPLLKVISELIKSGDILEKDIQIQYAGPSKDQFILQAKENNLLDLVVADGVVPKEQSLIKQLESHILILASWNNIGEEGVITGKFLEYMMMERPIVALISGNLAYSKIKEMIKDGNLGFCYEKANKNNDESNLKDYILSQYKLYKNSQSLEFNPNVDYVEKFNYKNIVKQLVKMFPENIKSVISE